MSNAPQDDNRVRDFLYEATDVMLEHPLDVPELAYKHDIAVNEAIGYTDMLFRLDATLVSVKPSSQFQRELRRELLGEPQRTALGRLRNLPPRLQWAAGVALLAAMALLGRKHFASEIQKLLQQLRTTGPFRDPKAAEVNVSAG